MITVRTMIEAAVAVHLSSHVESPFTNRSGMMIVGPPGVLKSSILEALDSYPDALPLSDINAQSLGRLKGDIAQGSIRTLVLPELAKVYERAEHTASHVEGTLRALVSEGFSAAGYENATLQRFKARCVVIGALTPDTYEKHSERWQKSGFSRRFLWCLVTGDTTRLERSAVDGEPLDFGFRSVPVIMPGMRIPDTTTLAERHRLAGLVKYQPGPHNEQIVLLTRMLAALKWWYKEERRGARALSTLLEWGQSLSRHGANLTYGPTPRRYK